MARASTEQGLIVTTRCQTTAALDEVIDCCGWPVLWQATPLRFRRQTMLIAPKISLFWLDAYSDMAIAARLLTWMETHERLVQRIVVAYRMSSDVEIAVRGAGTHLYLAADDNISALIDGWIPRRLRSKRRRELVAAPLHLQLPESLHAALEVDLLSSEPP